MYVYDKKENFYVFFMQNEIYLLFNKNLLWTDCNIPIPLYLPLIVLNDCTIFYLKL